LCASPARLLLPRYAAFAERNTGTVVVVRRGAETDALLDDVAEIYAAHRARAAAAAVGGGGNATAAAARERLIVVGNGGASEQVETVARIESRRAIDERTARSIEPSEILPSRRPKGTAKRGEDVAFLSRACPFSSCRVT
jgi:hypothetical protein